MAEELFINSVTLKKHTVIDGSEDSDKIMQHIFNAQVIHIRNLLGTDLYDRLQAGITASDLSANEVTLIDDYIQMTLVHYAAAEYFTFARYTASQGGVFQHQSDNAIALTQSDVDGLVKKERSNAEYFATRLINFLCENNTDYPEYSTNTGDDINPSKSIWRTGSWYMGKPLTKIDWRIDEV